MVPPRALASTPDAPAPSNLISVPILLMLGCDQPLVDRCRSIAGRAKVLVRSMPVPFHRADVASLKPLVIMTPKEVYEGAPWGFEVLAERVGASLLLLDGEPMAPIVLEYRVMEAMLFASRLRVRA